MLRVSKLVYLVEIRWTKTIQFRQRRLLLPLLKSPVHGVCIQKWMAKMLRLVPGVPSDPLFCLPSYRGRNVPLTSGMLLKKLRYWLSKLRCNSSMYTLHSLRRGGATHAFKCKVPMPIIRLMGDWISDCYLRYIDLTMDSRLKAMSQFA